MRRTFIPLAALALACGSVDEREGCATSADCPAGRYCAHTADGDVCWPDAAPPVVSEVVATCPAGGCRRDSTLHVTAAVSDDTGELLDASVALDLEGGPSVPMVRSGDTWEADVELRRFPFEHFARSVVATVTARDGARNVSAGAQAAAVEVTRLRWERAIDSTAVLSPTAPAVKDDGTVVIGGSNGSLYFITSTGANARPPLSVGAAQLTAAPAIGSQAIWVGSEDFNLYAIELDGSAVKANVGVNVGGAIRGSVAVFQAAGKEWGAATSAGGFVGVSSQVPNDDAVAGPSSAFFAGPVVGTDGHIFAATSTAASSLHSYRLNATEAVALNDIWNVPVGISVSAPIAIDGDGSVWTGTIDGKLSKITPGDANGTVTPVAMLGGAMQDSAVVLSSGDVVVGDDTGLLRRFDAAGTSAWSSPPQLGAAVQSPMVLRSSNTPFVVPTAGGKIFAIRNDGAIAWSATLEAGKSIRAPNIHTPASQPEPTMSTAYFANAGGKLFAVILDGELDASAPWPKAFHDPRNTNRAGPQP